MTTYTDAISRKEVEQAIKDSISQMDSYPFASYYMWWREACVQMLIGKIDSLPSINITSDNISREKALEIVDDALMYEYAKDAIWEIKKELLSLPIERGWIDCKESLPEVWWEYIICEDIWDWYKEVYTCWYDELHWFCYNVVDWNTFYPNVILWQPLPSPPTL